MSGGFWISDENSVSSWAGFFVWFYLVRGCVFLKRGRTWNVCSHVCECFGPSFHTSNWNTSRTLRYSIPLGSLLRNYSNDCFAPLEGCCVSAGRAGSYLARPLGRIGGSCIYSRPCALSISRVGLWLSPNCNYSLVSMARILAANK